MLPIATHAALAAAPEHVGALLNVIGWFGAFALACIAGVAYLRARR